jgi:hypothetical protein
MLELRRSALGQQVDEQDDQDDREDRAGSDVHRPPFPGRVTRGCATRPGSQGRPGPAACGSGGCGDRLWSHASPMGRALGTTSFSEHVSAANSNSDLLHLGAPLARPSIGVVLLGSPHATRRQPDANTGPRRRVWRWGGGPSTRPPTRARLEGAPAARRERSPPASAERGRERGCKTHQHDPNSPGHDTSFPHRPSGTFGG